MVKPIITSVLILMILCALLLINYAYKRRKMPAAKYFIMLLISAIFYGGAYIGEMNAPDLTSALVWFNLQHIPIPVQHYLWLLMSMEYARASKKHLQIAKYAGLYHPLLYIAIFFTNSYHGLYISAYRFESNGYFSVIITEKGPLFFLMVASGTLLGMIAMFYYLRGLLRATGMHRYGYLVMITSSILPWLTVYLNATNTSYLGIDYFPVVSIFSGMLYIFGIFYLRVFNTIPIATEIVFKQAKEGVILIDSTDYIVDANEAFLKIYPDLNVPAKGNFTSFLEKHPELNGISDENPVPQFTLRQNGQARYYSAVITKIVEEELEIGQILTVNDITLFVDNQKVLEDIASTAIDKAEINEISFLQAQINPHFLNNTLSVIGAMIKRDPEGARELIGNLGEYLANRCYFDSTSSMVLIEEELEAVRTYVAIEKTRFGERLNFQIIHTSTPALNIPRLILQPLVENAICHGILKKGAGGNIWLMIDHDEEKINFKVKDDGVGMPPEKLLRLTAEEKHNEGIGIPNIHKRLIKNYGAGLEIESRLGEGTIVAFSIPISGARA
ncbi:MULTISPECIES: histidine kinase N-terminal 7TM domain-containing protein [Anoxynatronum]|uniref:Two-component system, LytT family, sensor kinase n=2 Tax=Anoxynatronum TaxID=210622 RepID=A0AA45WZ86_9CLOT|nr:histidine kinase N-terminal 7TM domain-containing protein [Anoxynatronum buryatiense]SMP71043.1 two-component system, LytT family, sensor kinase [Anoxynatronum buryatiense]